MTNTEILNEYFIWEEKSLTEPRMKSENNGVNDHNAIMKITKITNEQENWRTITDPKLREKMRRRENNKKYRINHREKLLTKKKAYYEANKNKVKNYTKINREKINKRNQIWQRIYYNNNIQYKLGVRLRSRLYDALNVKHKVGSAVKDLGCSIDELKSYLESKFQPGMTWDNHTLDGWHIDHIKPLASFDLTDRKQFLEACHYTNLQPLWAKDNLVKSDKPTFS